MQKPVEKPIKFIKNLLTKGKSYPITHVNAVIDDNGESIKSIIDSLKNKGSLTKVTWLELKDKRDAGKLIPGSLYRITDYQCTTTQENTRSAGHLFDIVLLALSENKLAEEGWAMMNESNIYDVTFSDGVTKKCWIYDNSINPLERYNVVNVETLKGFVLAEHAIQIDEENKTASLIDGYDSDLLDEFDDLTYNYFQNSNLSAWKVWYCLDNDTSRFAWADDSVDEDTPATITSGNVVYVRDTTKDDETKEFPYGWISESFEWRYTRTTTPNVSDVISNSHNDPGRNPPRVQSYTPAHEGTGLPNGRGVIYRLIDELNNDVCYDFKNIQFKRFAITALQNGSDNMKNMFIYDALNNPFYYGTKDTYGNWTISGVTYSDNNYIFAYTFDGIQFDETGNVITHYDISAIPLKVPLLLTSYMDRGNTFGDVCYNNFIESTIILEADLNNSTGLILPNNVFFNYSYCYINSHTEDNKEYEELVYQFSNCANNTFRTNCLNNTFGPSTYSNIFEDMFYNNIGTAVLYNTFGTDCHENILGSGFNWNIIKHNCLRNIFGTQTRDNIFGNNFNSNTILGIFENNIFGNNTYGNEFGGDFRQNMVGNECRLNTFLYGCSCNIIGNAFALNTFGQYCEYNTFGNFCTDNVFSKYFQYCTLGNGVKYITVNKDYVKFITIENGNQKITITSNKTTSYTSSGFLQNFVIASGVNNSSTSKTISHNSLGDTFKTIYQSTNSTTVNV